MTSSPPKYNVYSVQSKDCMPVIVLSVKSVFQTIGHDPLMGCKINSVAHDQDFLKYELEYIQMSDYSAVHLKLI